jgi:hypothetical protein
MTNATIVARRRTSIAPSAAQSPIHKLLNLPFVKVAAGPKLGFTGIDAIPDQYVMELAGKCMEPYLRNGARAAFSKSETVRSGDFVCIWFRPEALKPGDFPGLFKKLSRDIPHFVTFPWVDHPESDISPALVAECFNPPRKFAIPCANVLAVHKCIGVVK